MPTITQLRNAARKANHAVHQAEAMERDKQNAKLIGRCFKYRNSGGGCGEKWWLYARIVKAEDGHLRVFKFQEYPSGHIDIDPQEFSMTVSMTDRGYLPIDRTEYDAAWADLRSKIDGLAA